MSPSVAPTAYQDLLEGKLIAKVTTSTTTGVKVKVKLVNGVAPTWTTVAHRVKVMQKTATVSKAEVWDVAAGTTQSGQTVTLGTITRALPLDDGTDFTGSGTAQSFAAGANVFLAWDSHDAAQSAKLDLANTFSANQTISSTNELRFADSATAIWDDGTTLRFKSSSQGSVTLDTLAATGGSDEKVSVSSNDTTPDYLVNKVTGGDGITVTETDDAGDETLDIDIDLDTDPGLEFDSGELRVKVKTSGGITRDSDGLSVDSGSLGNLAKLFGDGSDGVKAIAASEDLAPTSPFNYTTFSLDVGQTLGLSSANRPLRILVTGDVTINGTIDLDGDGGPGGAGSPTNTAGNGEDGTAGTAGQSIATAVFVTGGGGAGGGGVQSGGAGGGGGGGGSGASIITAGTAGSAGSTVASGTGGTAGSAGTKLDANLLAMIGSMLDGAICGGGGGGGGSGGKGSSANGGAGGNGGNGGGCMLMFVGGSLSFGASSVLTADATSGTNGTNAPGTGGGAGGGGGGGSGGSMVILVAGSITNGGVTAGATAGSAGTGGTLATDAGAGGNGAAGSAGKIIIYSISDGTFITA